jgi:hypothetical protein
MRLLLLISGILVVTAALDSRAKAQNYPWCALYDVGTDARNCGFVTQDQCMTTVSGIGGFCEPNTQYQSAVAAPVVRHKSRNHKAQD